MIRVVAVFLLGMGVLCVRAVRKAGRLARARYRSFRITVQPEGVSWETCDKTGLHQEYLDWRHAVIVCVAGYRASPDDPGHRLYILQAGETRLAWEWSSAASTEERAACEMLVRLAAAKTGLPLRDLMPGIRALEGAMRAATSWNWPGARAQRPLVQDQPDIPGIPLEAMQVWNRAYASLFIVPTVLGLAIEWPLLFGK